MYKHRTALACLSQGERDTSIPLNRFVTFDSIVQQTFRSSFLSNGAGLSNRIQVSTIYSIPSTGLPFSDVRFSRAQRVPIHYLDHWYCSLKTLNARRFYIELPFSASKKHARWDLEVPVSCGDWGRIIAGSPG
jgi:hypothetical protein